MRAPLAFAAAAGLLLSAAASLPAEAGCKRMAFLVNDYGKDGPTKDAKSLLDKHISEWAAQQGIKDYSIGTKSVSCYQFLNFIVFDEHTCTASANVCWGPDKKATDATTAAAPGTPPTPVRKTAATEPMHKSAKHKATAATHPDAATLAPAQDAAPAADTAAAPADDTAPSAAENAPAAPAATETGSTAPSVETGALGPAGPEGAAAPTGAAAPAAASDKGKASEAASAAAAAAERAAAAAETAANAAKEAAAAAVAASAAGRGSFVPPLGEAKSAHNLGEAH